jgi:hypothetical protein
VKGNGKVEDGRGGRRECAAGFWPVFGAARQNGRLAPLCEWRQENLMTPTNLSTMTLVRALQASENWDEQEAILADLRSRGDLFNLEPILQLAVDETKPQRVRRAAVVCAATQDEQKTMNWLRNWAEDSFTPAPQRKLAIQALAALQMPGATLPVLEAIASSRGAREARIEAIKLVGVYRNVRSTGVLMMLARDRDRAIAAAAQEALDRLIESNGGRYQVVARLKDRADQMAGRGFRDAAMECLRIASRLNPADGGVMSRLARLSAA